MTEKNKGGGPPQAVPHADSLHGQDIKASTTVTASPNVANDMGEAVRGGDDQRILATQEKEILTYGMKASGRRELLAHSRGTRITARARCKAQCYHCMGYFQDGKEDCHNPQCPMYPLMPYKGRESVYAREERERAEAHSRGEVVEP